VSERNDAWLAWQRDHADALAALQEAQRAYHRTVVERALAKATNVQEALNAVDAARVRLDAVRARKPE
jgi:hypothetical protein